jgi:hypothetical protein
MRLPVAVFAIAAILACGAASAARPYQPLESRLSADQMHATGLDQLSPAQLELLNRLLREEQTTLVAETAAVAVRDHARLAEEPVTSTIKGDFRGWQKGTVFELANGQRWRVTDDNEYYIPRALSAPKAVVKPGVLGSWSIEIEGVRTAPKVRRVVP